MRINIGKKKAERGKENKNGDGCILSRINKREEIVFYLVAYPIFFIIGYLFYKNFVISMFLGVVCIFFKGVYIDYLVAKRREVLLGQFKDWLYSLSSSISVGRSMEWAIKDSEKAMEMMYGDSYILEEVRLMIKSLDNMKMTSEQVLREFAKRTDIEDIRDFVDTYLICVHTGGNFKKAVLNIISILTDKMNIKREVKAIIAQRKLEGRVVATMPIAILFLLNSLSPDYLEPMYNTIIGRIIMSLAMISFIFAGVWIFKILNWK